MDITEIADAELDRLDLVGSPANGTGFLLMKALPDPVTSQDADQHCNCSCDGCMALARTQSYASGGMNFPDAAGIQKAGKKISAANAANIQNAIEALTGLLGEHTPMPEEGDMQKEEIDSMIEDKLTAAMDPVTKALEALAAGIAKQEDAAEAVEPVVKEEAPAEAAEEAPVAKEAAPEADLFAAALVKALEPVTAAVTGLGARLETVEKMAAPSVAHSGAAPAAAAGNRADAMRKAASASDLEPETRDKMLKDLSIDNYKAYLLKQA